MIRYVLALCSFAFATCEFAGVGVLPELARAFHVTLADAGLLISAYMAVITVGGPLLTIVGARINRRVLIVAAVGLGVICSAVTLVAQTYTVLLLARMGVAAGQAVFLAVALEVAAASVEAERRPSAIATVMNGFALANVVSLPASALAAAQLGWHWCFAIVACLMAASFATVVFTPIPQAHGSHVDVARAARAFAKKNVILGLLTTVLTFAAVMTVVSYILPLLRSVAHLSAPWASASLLLYGSGTVAGAWLGGRIRTGQITRVLPVPVALVALLLLAQLVALRTPFATLIWLFLLGLCVMSSVPLLQTWVMSQVERGAAGIAGSVNISAFSLAAVIGPLIGGAVISAGLGLQNLGVAAALPAICAVILALRIRS